MFLSFPLHQPVRPRSPSSGSAEAFGSWWRLRRASTRVVQARHQEVGGQKQKDPMGKGLSLVALSSLLHFRVSISALLALLCGHTVCI